MRRKNGNQEQKRGEGGGRERTEKDVKNRNKQQKNENMIEERREMEIGGKIVFFSNGDMQEIKNIFVVPFS